METFLAVAEERSFSRAAARLHRTQPAVRQAIAKLESELGEPLLEGTFRDPAPPPPPPPPVTHSVAKREREVGEPLLERTFRDGTPTDAGTVLKDYAQK